LRVTENSTPSGITVPRSASARAITDSATSAALTPGFFDTDSVTAGDSPCLVPCQT
jgi:hypothetical protein